LEFINDRYGSLALAVFSKSILIIGLGGERLQSG
jgi:hypothetical protein